MRHITDREIKNSKRGNGQTEVRIVQDTININNGHNQHNNNDTLFIVFVESQYTVKPK